MLPAPLLKLPVASSRVGLMRSSSHTIHHMHAGLMRCRFSMLGSIKRLAAMTSNLLLGGNMAMDVMASQV